MYVHHVVAVSYPEHREMIVHTNEEVGRAILDGRSRLAGALMREHMNGCISYLDRLRPMVFDDIVDGL